MTTKFTRDHEWIRIEGDVGTVGITDYAQQQLGDIVFIELPAVGTKVSRGGQIAVVESVKAASEIYAPAGGEIVAINEALIGDPAAVNRSPTADGWFFKMRLADPQDLAGAMDEAAYKAHVGAVSR